MNRASVIVVVVVIASTASADPGSRTFSMGYVEGTNLHIAGGRGAINWHADIKLTVELRADKKVEARAAGFRREHNMHAGPGQRPYNTDDETKLALRWTGTWAETAGKLQLDLRLVDDTCTRTKTSDGVPPENLACRPAAKQTVLTCTTETITLESLTSPAKRKVSAWQCSPAVADDLGESPTWLLGKTTCIVTSGDHMMGRGVFRSC